MVLLSVAMYGLAHMLLLTARAVSETAAVHARFVALGAAADGRVAESFHDGLGAHAASLPVGADTTTSTTHLGPLVERTVLRLSTETWLIEVTARDAAGLRAGTRVLAFAPDPGVRVNAWPFAVGVSDLDSLRVRGAVGGDAPPFGLVSGVGMGPLSLNEMLGESPPAGPIVRPAPVRAGTVCVSGATNWGAPATPGHPCSDHWVVRGRAGDLLLRDGEGQGVLVVDGDVTISSMHFHGVVLATGRVHLTDGARFVGRLVALAGFESDGDASVIGSATVAQRALRAAFDVWPPLWPMHPATSLGLW